MGRKGLSLQEKQDRMYAHFLETKQVETLKNLEKTMPKLKGIVSQSVKDVLEILVSDEKVISTAQEHQNNLYKHFSY